MTVNKKILAGATAGAIIAATVPVLSVWEGTDHVAHRDMIGTGHPITYCHGQTDEFGKVKVGARFSDRQCDEMLAASLPPYLDRLEQCIPADTPVKTVAALLDASYNAGTAAVCRSPMVRKINEGDIKGGCEAFRGWYITSDHVVRKGLVARRSGIKGDKRMNERQLCLEGLDAPTTPPINDANHSAVDTVKASRSVKTSVWSHVRPWIFKK